MINKKERVIIYIDGFNLFFALKKYSDKNIKWLDVSKLVKNITSKNDLEKVNFIEIKYFTAIVNNKQKKDKREKQYNYISALKTIPNLKVIYGNFIEKKFKIDRCGVKIEVNIPEEKGTDVNIGIEMVKDAYENNFDSAYLISNDSDLVNAVRISKNLSKKIVVFSPGKTISHKLKSTATHAQTIRFSKYKKSTFPDIIKRENKKDLIKPDNWI